MSQATQVNYTNLNFTRTPTTNFYLLIKPEENVLGGFQVNITLNYYLYDPNCEVNKRWNGTDCIVDYEFYCSSLTEIYREELNEPNLVVTYNGEGCVYNV